MPWYKQTYDWLERRVQLEAPVREAVLHAVPKSTASWWYVFGSASLTLLILQIVTGILLALVYTPSAGQGVEHPAVAQPRHSAGLVSACDAWMGIELHGRRGADPHGAGLPVRSVQVSHVS